MATITIMEGDFGSGVTARVGEDDLLLPDRARPGLSQLVPLGAVAEIEAIANDRSGQLKEAGRLAMRGAALLGPIGLAAGMFAVRKAKDVKFTVRLADGRSFGATTDAQTFAELRANFVRAKGSPGGNSASADSASADRVIAKYVEEKKEAARASLLDEPKARPVAPVEPALPAAPAEPLAAPVAPVAEPRRFGPALGRPAFGRRGQ